MSKKVFFFTLLSLLLFGTTISAQKNCNVDMLITEKMETEIVCFKRDTFPNDNFKTKYIFSLDGIEIYEINFSFFKETDSSGFKIFYIDKRINRSGTKNVKFENGSAYYIIKNFQANDTVINYSDPSYSILFSVPNKEEPYVVLNKFLSIYDRKTIFRLSPIDPEVKARQIKATNDFITMKVVDSTNKADYRAAFDLLKMEMHKYMKLKIQGIKNEEERNKIEGVSQHPNPVLQEEFTQKLDSIFATYFKRVNVFQSDDLSVRFSFNCNGNGKIKAESINFLTGPQNNWLKDTINQIAKTRIAADVYKPMTIAYTIQNLKQDFFNWFEEQFTGYTTPNLNRGDFTELLNQIADTLEQYEKPRDKSYPTIYTYSLKYKATVTDVVWRYERNNDGTDDIIDRTSDKAPKEEMTEELKTIFRNKITSGKKGKYHIKILSIYLRGALKPIKQDIQLIEK